MSCCRNAVHFVGLRLTNTCLGTPVITLAEVVGRFSENLQTAKFNLCALKVLPQGKPYDFACVPLMMFMLYLTNVVVEHCGTSPCRNYVIVS